MNTICKSEPSHRIHQDSYNTSIVLLRSWVDYVDEPYLDCQDPPQKGKVVIFEVIVRGI